MSIESDLTDYLVNKGLWPDDAEIAVAAVKAQNRSLSIRWAGPRTDYPPVMFGVLMMYAKREAAKLLDATQPNHFARRAFDPSS